MDGIFTPTPRRFISKSLETKIEAASFRSNSQLEVLNEPDERMYKITDMDFTHYVIGHFKFKGGRIHSSLPSLVVVSRL